MTATAQQDHKDATKGPNGLFKFSTWVHVGDGAADCEQAETGCADAAHFHAWCRLPNQLQHDDIRERALAAKARRIRQLHDSESDASQILESDMAELRRVAAVSDLVDELVATDWWKRQLEAMGDVEEDEVYKHVDRDRARLGELRALDPDARPRDEYDELERHLTGYNERVDARRGELEQPVRASLEQLGQDELVAQIRAERISAEASGAFMECYTRWEWLAGTFTSAGLDRRRVYTDINQLRDAAPEVLDALKAAYAELEAALQRGPRGN